MADLHISQVSSVAPGMGTKCFCRRLLRRLSSLNLKISMDVRMYTLALTRRRVTVPSHRRQTFSSSGPLALRPRSRKSWEMKNGPIG